MSTGTIMFILGIAGLLFTFIWMMIDLATKSKRERMLVQKALRSSLANPGANVSEPIYHNTYTGTTPLDTSSGTLPLHTAGLTSLGTLTLDRDTEKLRMTAVLDERTEALEQTDRLSGDTAALIHEKSVESATEARIQHSETESLFEHQQVSPQPKRASTFCIKCGNAMTGQGRFCQKCGFENK